MRKVWGKYRNGRIVVSLSLGGLVGPQGSPQWQKVVTCCRGKEVSGGDGEFLIVTQVVNCDREFLIVTDGEFLIVTESS